MMILMNGTIYIMYIIGNELIMNMNGNVIFIGCTFEYCCINK